MNLAKLLVAAALLLVVAVPAAQAHYLVQQPVAAGVKVCALNTHIIGDYIVSQPGRGASGVVFVSQTDSCPNDTGGSTPVTP